MFDEFKNKYLGASVDIDGQFGSQCVDLFNAWNRDYNNTYINCSPSGYAHSIAENKENNKILNYFIETQINNMIEGTVVVYGKCRFAPSSHICFFIKDNGDGTYQALQQNSKGRMYVTIDNNPYDGIIGAFIPKQLLNKNKEYINIPPSIEERNIYHLNEVQFATIKPKKFGGLSYEVIRKDGNFAIINTCNFGQVKIKITDMTPITSSPQYEHGNY